jgi:hypothetical protein
VPNKFQFDLSKPHSHNRSEGLTDASSTTQTRTKQPSPGSDDFAAKLLRCWSAPMCAVRAEAEERVGWRLRQESRQWPSAAEQIYRAWRTGARASIARWRAEWAGKIDTEAVLRRVWRDLDENRPNPEVKQRAQIELGLFQEEQ